MAPDRLRRDRKGKIVILDSSAIFMPFEFSINLESELSRLLGKYHVIIPKQIFEEIKLLSEKGKGKKKLIAKPALELIKGYEQIDTQVAKNGDDAVLYLAKIFSGIVVTNDRELRKRVKKESLHTIYLRSKKHLVME